MHLLFIKLVIFVIKHLIIEYVHQYHYLIYDPVKKFEILFFSNELIDSSKLIYHVIDRVIFVHSNQII